MNKEEQMTIKEFIKVLRNYPQNAEIEIECPNGLLVEPKIKNNYVVDYDTTCGIIGYVVSWRD